MPAKSNETFLSDPAVLGLLACPACREDLRLEEARLVCVGCGRVYPIVNGIPVLIVERAESSATLRNQS